MKDSRYKLFVTTGMYESDTLIGLFVEILRHRTWHLLTHGKWVD
jgi:hypothetical protein